MIRVEHIVIVRKVICQVRPYHVFHDLSSESGIVFRTMASDMKHFRLAGAGYRTLIDLTIYRTDIESAVKKVKPLAEIDVHKS